MFQPSFAAFDRSVTYANQINELCDIPLQQDVSFLLRSPCNTQLPTLQLQRRNRLKIADSSPPIVNLVRPPIAPTTSFCMVGVWMTLRTGSTTSRYFHQRKHIICVSGRNTSGCFPFPEISDEALMAFLSSPPGLLGLHVDAGMSLIEVSDGALANHCFSKRIRIHQPLMLVLYLHYLVCVPDVAVGQHHFHSWPFVQRNRSIDWP